MTANDRDDYQELSCMWDDGSIIGQTVCRDGECSEVVAKVDVRTYGGVYVGKPIRYRRLFNICELSLQRTEQSQ